MALGGQFVLGALALPGNPYDGHTLAAQIAQTERVTGARIERAYVDRGYRDHDADRDRVALAFTLTVYGQRERASGRGMERPGRPWRPGRLCFTAASAVP